MRSFIDDEGEFKRTAKELTKVIHEHWKGRVEPDDIIPYLVHAQDGWSSSYVREIAKRIAGYVNKYPDSPGIGRVQQALTEACLSSSYQDFHDVHSDKNDVRELFDIDIPGPRSLTKSMQVQHPFPLELQKIETLKPLKLAWDIKGKTSRSSMFIPSLPPCACFGTQRLSVERFQNWIPSKRGRDLVAGGTCGLVLKDGGGHLCGAVRWYWWGHAGIEGVNYSLALREAGQMIAIGFDLRPTSPSPTWGPIIRPLNEVGDSLTDSFNQFLLEIREIAPYAEPNEE